MQRQKVEEIFNRNKERFFIGRHASRFPVAFMLGGQGAVGKGQLNQQIIAEYSSFDFLEINGDDYRCYHPDYQILKDQKYRYSTETQVFSSVFTEGLIRNATEKKISMIIEGTMRSNETVSNTAAFLKSHGYVVKAFVIAAPKEYSTINAIERFTKEYDKQGFGRMIDFRAHDAAARGVLASVDRLYDERLVNEIRIYDMFADHLCFKYMLSNNCWNTNINPSSIIDSTRSEQLKSDNQFESFHETAKRLLRDNIEPELSSILVEALNGIENTRERQKETEQWHFHR